MGIQLNQNATGVILEKATKRFNGQMMRTFILFIEAVSTEEDKIVAKYSKVNIVCRDKNGKVTYMDDSCSTSEEYKLNTGYPMFFKFEFDLFEDQWKALLQGNNISLTFMDEIFDISYIVNDLTKYGRNK